MQGIYQSSTNALYPSEGQYSRQTYHSLAEPGDPLSKHIVRLINFLNHFGLAWRGVSYGKRSRRKGRLSVTNYLSLYLLEKFNENAVLVISVGYDDGFSVSHILGLSDPKGSAKSLEGNAREARR
ncbi:hypothetical protein PABG_11435 [Paracoccidioides brasiliensis Pb03]|nr:hypothetical protein PABG_11435 [Paracoccidioides brasiliensis Pb03]